MKIYGPYIRKDGRSHVILIDDSGKRRTVSYPKYLMEQHLGRKLSRNETVDHMDGDFTNDDISNLQILDRVTHAKLDVKRAWAISKCVWCNVVFELTKDQINSRSKDKAGPFCSRSCSGKYGASVQHNKIPKKKRDDIDIVYYSLKQEPNIGNSVSADGDIGETFDMAIPREPKTGTVETR